MISILSSDSRAIVRSSLALITVAALAACDNDSPLEPTVPSIPTTVQSAVIPNGLGNIVLNTVTIEANVKKVVGGAKFSYVGPRTSGTVSDNDQKDGDPTWGRIRLSGLLPGTFTLCEIVAPVGYAMSAPACHQITVVANGTTTDEFNHLILPHTQFQVRNAANQAVGGATFTIKTNTTTIIVVTDNDAKDLNKTGGFFTVRLPGAGSFWVCPATAPAGYVFANPTCRYSFYQNGYFTNIGAFQLVALQP